MPTEYTDEEKIEAILDPTKWHVSAKGNEWRRLEDTTISVFFHRGYWKWCVSFGGDDTHFSDSSFRTMQEAKEDLACAIVS